MLFVHSMVTSYWKWTLAFVASRYTNMDPLFNSSDSMHMVVLSAVVPATYWCIVFLIISKCAFVTMHINLSKYMFSSNRTCFLSFPRWVCQMGGIASMPTMTCMLLNSLACDQQHYSPCLLRASYWDGYITCMGVISSICACCTPYCTCSYCNSFSHMCSSYSSLSHCFNTCNSSIPFSLFVRYLCPTVTS